MSGRPVRKALLTGATGFIGAHLTRALLLENWDLHLIVRPDSSFGSLVGLESRLRVYTHDGTTEQLCSLIDEIKPDVVFHLASLFLAQHKPSDISQLITSNVVFGTQLVEAMVHAECYCIVNTGTSWEHYENSDYDPVNLYAASKHAFEAMLEYYLNTTPLTAITLKLFDTYGSNDPRPKLIPLLKKAMDAGESLSMSPGEQLIDLVYIDDVVRAFMLAAERLLEGQAVSHERYAISSGNPIRLRELVERFGRAVGRTLPVEWGGRPYRPREVMAPWSNGKFLPGWQPQVGLEEGLSLIMTECERNCTKVIEK